MITSPSLQRQWPTNRSLPLAAQCRNETAKETGERMPLVGRKSDEEKAQRSAQKQADRKAMDREKLKRAFYESPPARPTPRVAPFDHRVSAAEGPWLEK